MGEAEIGQFLSSLATEAQVSASTQNQALNALLFPYREVLEKPIGYINGVVRAKRPSRLPVVLTRQEVRAILDFLDGPPPQSHSLGQVWLRRGGHPSALSSLCGPSLGPLGTELL